LYTRRSVFERSTLRYRAFPYFGVLNILGTGYGKGAQSATPIDTGSDISYGPIDWRQKNFPSASYPEIKNQVGYEEGASPVLV
jgi:hypothetical protein